MAVPLNDQQKAAVKAVLDVLSKRPDEPTVSVNLTDKEVKDHVKYLKSNRIKNFLASTHKITLRTTANAITLTINAGAGDSRDMKGADVQEEDRSYYPPSFHRRIKALIDDTTPHNIWLTGPTGCGKTEYVRWLGKTLGRKVYKINCREDMGTPDFVGEKTVDIDPESLQNFVRFVEGRLVRSMLEGLDEEGNEIGKPGILFIDEAAAMPAQVAILFNGVLENTSPRRRFVIDADGGREIFSHSGWLVFFASNTIGRGHVSLQDVNYTAQGNALDISTLDRFAAVFRFGYNKPAELNLLEERIKDRSVIDRIINLRDVVRQNYREGRVHTPFSTRTLISVADGYRVWNSLEDAIFYGVLSKLPREEAIQYNEFVQADNICKKDLMHAAYEDEERDYLD